MRGRGIMANLTGWGVALRTKILHVKGWLTTTYAGGAVILMVRPAVRDVVARVGIVLADGC